ncbi:unnamed protein product [Cladocopium goreaui]|uniref:PDZ domain-containing protein n=1 Tax=Cladocopium goreaui TaxID=2562237 RepID=A0A9P1BG42_9DINO|nr:unnamed protein product [Cladocopium goreaui]
MTPHIGSPGVFPRHGLALEPSSTSPAPEIMRFEVGPVAVEVTVSTRVIGLIPDNWPPNPVFVAAVVPGSLVEAQGVLPGDELRAVNGFAVKSLQEEQLAMELRKRPAFLTFQRGAVGFASGARPAATSPTPGPLKILDLTFGPQQGMLGLVPETWPPGPVILGDVVPGSASDLGGAEAGDVILLVNDLQAALLEAEELSQLLRQRPLKVRFLRGASAAATVKELLLQALAGPEELWHPRHPTPEMPEYLGTWVTDG